MNKNAKRRAICANKIELSRMNDCTLPSTNDYRAITSCQLVRHVLASPHVVSKTALLVVLGQVKDEFNLLKLPARYWAMGLGFILLIDS